ncbi:MAG: IS701 family transposase [Rhodopirellula sp.]|nr:IS701 family transposase [Rhodopirellula sp.]
MMMTGPGYEPKLLEKWRDEVGKGERIEAMLEEYLSDFNAAIGNRRQRAHVRAYVRGLLSDLDRKSVEPIALSILGEGGVRPMQQFLTRSNMNDARILQAYRAGLARRINSRNGMLSVDESDFEKKGKESAGVQRQYCGRLGKTENCQAGVFLAYAGEDGYGLVDRELYIPERWYLPENARRRERCRIPQESQFETKNDMALRMVLKVLGEGCLHVKWIGCDSAFGSDHGFLDALPDTVYYFAAVKSSEQIYLNRPILTVPEKTKARGRPSVHALPSEPQTTVKAVAEDAGIPWQKVVLAEGSKGKISAQVKIIRCVFCRASTTAHNYPPIPAEDGWLYIRRYENGDIKYFVSNAPETIAVDELHEAATLRWPIEQCFEECKGFLGMGHYECRTLGAWRRHMLLVMLAHGFATSVRLSLKKTASLLPVPWQSA